MKITEPFDDPETEYEVMQKTLNIRKFAALAVLSLLVIAGCGKKPGASGKADLKKPMTAADSAVTATKVPLCPERRQAAFLSLLCGLSWRDW